MAVVSERWKQIGLHSIRHVAVHEDDFECAIDESCGETFKTYANASSHAISFLLVIERRRKAA